MLDKLYLSTSQCDLITKRLDMMPLSTWDTIALEKELERLRSLARSAMLDYAPNES